MGIINRDLARSEKNNDETFVFGALVTGASALLKVVPFNALLTSVNVAAFGLSNSPIWSLEAFRFTSAGLTTLTVGGTITLTAIGTSGCIGFSLAAPGFSLLAGDVLVIRTGGANTATANSAVSVVMQPLADIKVFQNSVV